MASQRSTNILSPPPKVYGRPKGTFWEGTKTTERFPPTYPSADQVFGEYMRNGSMVPSPHAAPLSQSQGLLELHYNTMRKNHHLRMNHPASVSGPTMDRTFSATTGYSGFVSGKESANIIGTTFGNTSALAHELRGKYYDPPMSGMTYHLAKPTNPMYRSTTMQRSGSAPGPIRTDLGPMSPSKAALDGYSAYHRENRTMCKV